MGRRVALLLVRLIGEEKLGKDKINETKINETKNGTKIDGTSINKKKIKTKIDGASINKKKIKAKIDGTSINKKKIRTKSNGGLSACPIDKMSRVRKAAAGRLRHAQVKSKTEELSMEQPNDIFLERWTARAAAWRDRFADRLAVEPQAPRLLNRRKLFLEAMQRRFARRRERLKARLEHGEAVSKLITAALKRYESSKKKTEEA